MPEQQPTASAGDVDQHLHPCACGHDVYWHHQTRGCGYHGHDPRHACPCRLTHTQALATLLADVRREERERVLGEVEDAAERIRRGRANQAVTVADAVWLVREARGGAR